MSKQKDQSVEPTEKSASIKTSSMSLSDISAIQSLYQKALESSSSQESECMALLEECVQNLRILPFSDQKQHLLADCAFQLAIRFERKNQMEKAIDYYRQSLEVMQKLPDYHSSLRILNQAAGCYAKLAWIYLQKEEKAASIENIQKALEIYEKISACSNSAKAYASLTMGGYYNAAVIFNYFGRQKQALGCLEKSIERQKVLARIYGAVDIYEGLAHSYALKARIYAGLKEYQKALAERMKVIEIFKDLLDKNGLAKEREELAKAYDLAAHAAFQALEDQAAIELFLKRIEMHKEDYQKNPDDQNRLLLARDYQSLAGLYQACNQPDQAEKAKAAANTLLNRKE